MTAQLDLLEYTSPAHAAARHTDPATSHEAAQSLTTQYVTEREWAVLDALKLFGPCTIEEVTQHTGLSLVTVSPRFRPLVRKGMIADSGERRLNASGRKAIVWRLT